MARIQISGNKNDNVLSITLRQILECVKQGTVIKWKVMWLEGISNKGENILKLEDTINQSLNGVSYSYQELLDLSDSLSQLIEVVVIGDREENKLIRYKNDVEMYNSCEYVIELVDSSYWEFSSHENESVNIIKSNFAGVKNLL